MPTLEDVFLNVAAEDKNNSKEELELKFRTEQEWKNILLKALEILRRYQYTPYRVFLEKGC